jgi:HEAT repeat protein
VFIKGLKDEDPEIRQNVVEALGEMGTQAAKAIPALKATLKDEDEAVCDEAREALQRILSRDKKAPAPKKKAPAPKKVEPRKKVVYKGKTVDQWIAALKDKDSDVRKKAADALKELQKK